jgi:FkbM family methyltransferase
MARFLGVNDVLRNVYFHFAFPRGGVLSVKVFPASARFYVRTPLQLRCLEPDGEMGGERRTLELLLSLVRPGDVVYDIGANFGLYSVLLGQVVGTGGRVVAFEPDERSNEFLQKNLRLNGLNNVQCFQKALGDQDQIATLHYHKEGPGTSSLVECPSHIHSSFGNQTVFLVHGDSFIKTESLPVPRLIKIDVEGFEIAVLEGLRQTLAHPQVEYVFCEVHPHLLPSGQSENSVQRRLEGVGFSSFQKLPGEHPTFHLIAWKGDASSRS